MNNKEAIEWIKNHLYDEDGTTKQDKAMEIAISALENIDRITAERDAAVEQLHRNLVACNYCKKLRKTNILMIV